MGRPHCAQETLPKRFWSYVQKTSKCWLWKGTRFNTGYGSIYTGSYTCSLAHRVSWMLHRGEISDGMQINHRCDNRACVRPAHLYVGTQQENVDDAIARNRFVLPAIRRGEENNKAKLTAGQVRQIRKAHVDRTMTRAELAIRFNVTPHCIKAIVERRTWRHL